MSSHPLQAVTLYPQSGPPQDYVRDGQDGETKWRLAKTTFGRGAPSEAWPDSPHLAPGELARLIEAALE